MGKCPKTGTRGDKTKQATGPKPNMVLAIGRGLICGWEKPTKPLLHNTN